MIPTLASGGVWVARTTARTDVRLEQGDSRRVRAALASMDLAPSMPAASILIVRSVTGHLPASRRQAARAAADLRARVESLAARAARPARGDSGNAEAVWFRDESELMACLIEDVVRGRSGSRWYWRSIAERFGWPFSMTAALGRAPEILPAIVAALDARRVTTLAIILLTAAEAAGLTLAMLRAHGQSDAAGAVRTLLTGTRPGNPRSATISATGTASSTSTADHGVASEDRHHDVLGVEHAVLLRLARALATTSGRQSSSLVAEARKALSVEAPPRDRSGERQSEHREPTPGALEYQASVPRSVASQQAGMPSAGKRNTRQSHERRRATPEAAADRSSSSRPGEPPAPTATPEVTPPLETCEGARAVERAQPDSGWSTRYGGVFYLIRAVDELAQPDEFALLRVRMRPLGRWTVFELVMRKVLESARAFDPEDGLWPALAELDGRDTADRLPSRLPRRLGRSIEAAAAGLVAWVRDTLAITCDDARDVVDECIATRALISVTPMHLDISAPLDAIRIPVRRAGLDVDPGWLPAWGRIVRFHFLDRSEARAS